MFWDLYDCSWWCVQRWGSTLWKWGYGTQLFSTLTLRGSGGANGQHIRYLTSPGNAGREGGSILLPTGHAPSTFLDTNIEAKPPLPVQGGWGSLGCKGIIWPWHWTYWAVLVLPYCIAWKFTFGNLKTRGIISRWTLTKKHTMLSGKKDGSVVCPQIFLRLMHSALGLGAWEWGRVLALGLGVALMETRRNHGGSWGWHRAKPSDQGTKVVAAGLGAFHHGLENRKGMD